MSQEAKDFEKVLGKVPSGLFIITAAQGDKRSAFLASFVQQVSFDPLVFAIACHPDRYPYSMIKESKKFAINIIPEGDSILMKTFAKGHGPDEDPMASVSLDIIEGVPTLKDAIGAGVFELVDEANPGDHAVLFGKAIGGILHDENLKPWVHVRKSAMSY
ncbi:MAG: flavin reductase family protein [Deltaproteobacteria bacterium]|nr:flavin reductase family protein [Deltaproteobacteria bacterium]